MPPAPKLYTSAVILFFNYRPKLPTRRSTVSTPLGSFSGGGLSWSKLYCGLRFSVENPFGLDLISVWESSRKTSPGTRSTLTQFGALRKVVGTAAADASQAPINYAHP